MTTPHESYLAVPHERVPVGQIRPAEYNPRDMDDDAREGLGESLETFGLVEPLVWNRRTGNLVGGHQRFGWLTAQGAGEVDCVVVDLDDEDERALNIALNHQAIAGHFTEGLGDLLKDISERKPDAFVNLRLAPLTLQFPSAEDALKNAVGQRTRGKPKGCCPRCGTAVDPEVAT